LGGLVACLGRVVALVPPTSPMRPGGAARTMKAIIPVVPPTGSHRDLPALSAANSLSPPEKVRWHQPGTPWQAGTYADMMELVW